MSDSIINEEELRQNLKDAGISDDEIEYFMCLYQSNKSLAWMRFLRNHRSHLLKDIHVGQDKLFCLDYLIRKLKLKERL